MQKPALAFTWLKSLLIHKFFLKCSLFKIFFILNAYYELKCVLVFYLHAAFAALWLWFLFLRKVFCCQPKFWQYNANYCVNCSNTQFFVKINYISLFGWMYIYMPMSICLTIDAAWTNNILLIATNSKIKASRNFPWKFCAYGLKAKNYHYLLT